MITGQVLNVLLNAMLALDHMVFHKWIVYDVYHIAKEIGRAHV